MLRWAANLTMLFTERPLLERPTAAARAGFAAVEVQFPYDAPVEDWRAALREAGVPLVLHNLPAGDWAGGERGIACHPDRVAEFRDGVARALDYARALAVPRLNVIAGLAPPHVPAVEARQVLVDNLRWAARALQPHGIQLLLEPINTFDVPGFFIHRTAQALEVLDAAGAPNVALLYDIYHAQRMEGELIGTLRRHWARIGHVQIADNPGRHEPGSGEIAWEAVLGELDRLGYDGWVGCEYHPRTTTEEGLGWRARWA
ncbi:Hydroxypyruvate isomerase [Tepidimonas alkaliphilus]|uniref:Hydroxypyruvate isomerase n=1 Tax=Tepidimonas alkaliphilus TaxID=2588942 RepID=A0A554WBF3_9BURK|nr:hydroxypyruvate isomerase [Tepidimonas alkaliphilus]TSE20903.1 Hydroxypyruvate isomerase [Tepidimonas alkaliphilus]